MRAIFEPTIPATATKNPKVWIVTGPNRWNDGCWTYGIKTPIHVPETARDVQIGIWADGGIAEQGGKTFLRRMTSKTAYIEMDKSWAAGYRERG
jgi:hypothetical protein